MGGRIALLTATLIPDRFACLILESASPGIVSPDGRARRARSDEALARLITEKGVEAFSTYWEDQPLFASQKRLPREVKVRIRNLRLRNNPIGIANTLRAAGTGIQPPVHKLLPRLKIPVLSIAGEYDHKFSAIAKDMCSQLPDGRLSIIPGAGHAPHIEKPRAFNKVVLAFLGEL
jgi:2-succinyl-6-hydroxy-2,4-cyclohexadiene-1-carboxylate synthase